MSQGSTLGSGLFFMFQWLPGVVSATLKVFDDYTKISPYYNHTGLAETSNWPGEGGAGQQLHLWWHPANPDTKDGNFVAINHMFPKAIENEKYI